MYHVTATFIPERASDMAVVEPAGPAPIIRTS